MDADRNLLFGVLALQADLLTSGQFAEACSAWAGRKDTPLADLLVQRGWLDAEQRGAVELLLRTKLHKHQGDVKASLAEVTTDPVKRSLAGIDDPDVRQSLAGLSPPPPEAAHVLFSTTDHLPETRERYTLSRLHATGGIGRVWLARDASLGRDVALKELRPERAGHPAVWARFLKEAQITGQLEHPGVVPIYEVGRRPEDQSPFYTMRFVRGRTLAEAVRGYHRRRAQGEAGPLELRELLTAFVGVCNAVAYAHSRGVLHRDLKPSNVVLGDYGEVIVLDWGLAKLLDQPDGEADLAPLQVEADGDGTAQGQVLGTPAYMAPEQAEGRLDQLGPATDVYGLGAVLYEILTGRPPFRGEETPAVLRQVIHEPPARPRSVVPAVPAALEAVCLKGLAKRPAGRYGSAKELAAEVQRWLADEPVTAYREPWAARAGRWVKRRRVLVTSTAAAGLVALVGLAVVLVLQARANSDLREANERERQRFDLAMEAIQAFHTGVSEDVLLKEKPFDDLRAKLLGGAAAFYGKLEKLLEGQNDAPSRRSLGRAYYQLGELTERIGSRKEAMRLHEQALAVRRELSEVPGANSESGLEVGMSMLAVSDLRQATGDLPGALALYQESQKFLRQLARGDPGSTPIQSALARSHNSAGVILRQIGRPQEALAAHQEALAIRQALADTHPEVAQFQDDLATTENGIAVVLHRTGRPGALAAFQKVQALRKRVADAHPASVPHKTKLVHIHQNVGTVLEERGKTRAALDAFQQSLPLAQELADAYPAVIQFQSDLAQSLHHIGILADAGQPEAALAAREKALAIRQKLAEANPNVTWLQTNLAESLAVLGSYQKHRGRFADAAASYRKSIAVLERVPHLLPEDLYNLACSRALLAGIAANPEAGLTADEGRAVADQAMYTLKKVATTSLPLLRLLREDNDFDALRRREDYQELIRELEARKKRGP